MKGSCKMNNKEIGLRILAARKKLGYTQKQLGDLINVSDKAVSKWERGVGCPDISLLLPLSEVLDMTIDELIGGNVLEKNETKTIQNLINYTKAKAIEYKERIIKICYLLITIGMMIGIFVSCLCDHYLNNSFTWSIISTTAIIYAWFIVTTFVYSVKYRVAKSIIVAAIGVIPMLFIIADQLYTIQWFYQQALITAIMSNIYVVLIIIIWYKTDWSIWYKVGIYVYLSIIVNFPANYFSGLNTVAQIANIASNIIIGSIIIAIGYSKKGKL